MYKNVNCTYNEEGPWCTHKKIKRSLFGLGAKICLVFDNKDCPYQQKFSRLDKTNPPQGQKVKGK